MLILVRFKTIVISLSNFSVEVGSNQNRLKPQDTVFVLRLSDNHNEEFISEEVVG
jgi:hypothetical protein